jgi:drug/metabolite transporter (DMT)-like permease
MGARSLLLVGVVIWGWTFVATKVCLAHLRPVELFGLRLLIGLPVLMALALLRRTPMAFTPHARALLLGSLIITAHFLIQITGLQYTSATHTGWIIAVSPLVMALLASRLLGEPIGRNVAAGIAVATVGILILVSGGNVRSLGWLRSVGDWLVLASAHTWALYTVAIRDVARKQDPIAVSVQVLLPVAAAMLAYMALCSDWSSFLRLPARAWAALLFLGVLGTAVAHLFWQIGVARIGATRAGVFLYLEPLATTALAVPYLGEPVGAATLAGGGLVLLGVWLAQRPARPRLG